MIYIELLITIVTLLTHWLITNDYKVGLYLGVIAQIGWMSLFIHTGQYGILICEVLSFMIYVDGSIKYFRKGRHGKEIYCDNCKCKIT